MHRLIPALLLLAPLATAAPALAEDVPHLDIAPVCRMIAKGIYGDQSNVDSCMRTEADNRQRLAQEWNEFPAADRASCLSLTKMGGVGGTYTELMICLEMSRDVAKLHRGGGTIGQMDR